jgi:ubiquinone/menaquinone biosynthesis C-methylase UbiE
MKVFYDEKNNRLVYIRKKASPDYWDEHWEKYDIKNLYPRRIHSYDPIVRYTKKFLPVNGRILEGGCGLGQNVYKLHKIGYDTIGVDYAEKTVDFVKSKFPELNIIKGDVGDLPFPDDYFDGYWSIGVIEHFYEGYDGIIKEMHRVVKKGGYVFVTFPHMSVLRRIKSKLNFYPTWKENIGYLENFYQFALDENRVIEDFENYNFKLIEKRYLDGLKGLKDEIQILKPILQKMYDSNNLAVKIIGASISIFVSRFTSHSILLIFKKT